MSDPRMTGPERHYARLIRLYPAAYRRERGDEMLDTVLESGGDPRRETIGLLVGALRAHAGRDSRPWLAAFHAGAMMLLVTAVAQPALQMLLDVGRDWPPLVPFEIGYAVAVGAGAIVAVLLRRYLVALLLSAVAFGLAQLVETRWEIPNMWQLPLVIGLLVPLLRQPPERVHGVLRYLPVLPLLLIAADYGLTEWFPDVSGLLRRGLDVALVMAALLWLAIDERVAMALGLLTLESVVVLLAYDGSVSWMAVIPAVLLVGASVRTRYTARV